ncbi:glycosyltransferase family 2 protein [Flavobacteriales bacterium]|nr:glycosyltransferase family 2 protein [Flavobacteriales bacterium]
MLSILIPIYNFDVTELIGELSHQAEKLNIPHEIICIDDKSESSFVKKNKVIDEIKSVIYSKLSKNIGRSKIRNLLATKAQFENLLFLDCDTKINTKNFLKNYIEIINDNDVIVGGIEYEPLQENNRDLLLRWLYGKNREEKKAIVRTKNPYVSFSACNMLIKKSICNKIFFSETISQYGHEDTLYGIELKSLDIKVKHIDNPIVHLGLDETSVFIRKTELGLENFKSISTSNPEIIYLTKIGRFANAISYTLFLTKPIFKGIRFLSKSLLLKGSKNLILFDLFKLSFLLSLEKN